MIDITIVIILNSFLIQGAWYSMDFSGADELDSLSGSDRIAWYEENPPDKIQRKSVLWFIRYYGGIVLPERVRKPLYECSICMASIWSIIPYACLDLNWWGWPLYVFTLAGVNMLTNRIT